jgi:hypothetical protein
LQREGLSAIRAEAASLLVRLEGLQEMITNVACLHRTFFQWLVVHARAQGNTAPSEGASSRDTSDGEYLHALNLFLEHCFASDPVMEELEVRGAPAASLMRHEDV